MTYFSADERKRMAELLMQPSLWLLECMWAERERAWKMEDEMEIKDSGKREQYSSGMQRDVTEGKVDYLLALDGPMFERWAAHLTAGSRKYDKRNWMKAAGAEELERFRESALRHFVQWLRGDQDEDHAAAVLFNVNGVEYVKLRMVEKVLEEQMPLAPGSCQPDEWDYNGSHDVVAEMLPRCAPNCRQCKLEGMR